MKRHLSILAVLFGLFLLAPTAARAQSGCGYGGGYGWDGGYGWLYNTLRYEVPHFAAFPPVYYSAPVPRTYGYSPFAYPPNVMTPEIVEESEPLTIVNPYVPENKMATPPAADPTSDHTAAVERRVEPLVILNPYVTQRGTVAKTDR